MIKPETAKAYRKLLVGVLTVEYAMLELKDEAKFDLKQRINKLLNSCKSIQDSFTYHENSNAEYIEYYKKQFCQSEIFMLSELMETVWGMSDEGLEIIINAVKTQMQES